MPIEAGEFGVGLDFLAAWHAWQRDARRPRMLHHVARVPQPPAPADLVRAAASRLATSGLTLVP